jgi:hypothetical protein
VCGEAQNNVNALLREKKRGADEICSTARAKSNLVVDIETED